MKILFFGSNLMVRRLTDVMGRDEMNVVGISDEAKALSLLARERFDMVIVDSIFQESADFCRNIAHLNRLPVAVMLQEKAADWQQIRALEVDGYLYDGAGKAEIMARLKAVSRRKMAAYRIQDPVFN
jgi:DNA-binding response OmpR family regulator